MKEELFVFNRQRRYGQMRCQVFFLRSYWALIYKTAVYSNKSVATLPISLDAYHLLVISILLCQQSTVVWPILPSAPIVSFSLVFPKFIKSINASQFWSKLYTRRALLVIFSARYSKVLKFGPYLSIDLSLWSICKSHRNLPIDCSKEKRNLFRATSGNIVGRAYSIFVSASDSLYSWTSRILVFSFPNKLEE